MAKKTMGRPRKEIEKEQFEKLCVILCTEEEIAAFFECSVDTIGRFCKREYGKTFAETYKTFESYGKISLRRSQFRLAEKSPAMAIFLGKNYLGQRDDFEYQNNEAVEKLDRILDGLEINAKTE